MQIKITKNGNYKEFKESGGMRAQYLEAGAVVDLPEAYGRYLVTAGLGEEVEAKKEAPAAKPAPVLAAKPAPEHEPAPEPGEMTVAEIRDLDLTAEQWLTLLDDETAGKNRKSVIEHATSQLP